MDTKELEAQNLLECSPVEENGAVLGHLFPVVHNNFLCLDHVEGEVFVVAPHGQASDLKVLQRVVCTVQDITGTKLTANKDLQLKSEVTYT